MWRMRCSINPKHLPDGVTSSVSSMKKGTGGAVKGKRRVFFSLRCRMGIIKGRVKDDGCYSKGNKVSAANTNSAAAKRHSVSDEFRGLTTVDLIKREGSSLGLTISGGSDKDSKPRVSNLRPGGLAARSDQLNVGDYIKSVNGINLSKLRHDEIISMLKNVGERVVLEVEYELPPVASSAVSSVISKTIEVRLEKEGNSFGFVLRGGFHEDWRKARPLVVTYIRPGGPADRGGTLRVGDRVLSVNGAALNRHKHADVLTLLLQSNQEASFLIEYDVTVMDSVQNHSGPLQVEIMKSSGSVLGLTLSSSPYRNKHVITIQKIKAASVADRCGALHVGDVVLAIDGVSTERCTVMEAQQLLTNSPDTTKLEILPTHLQDTVRVQRSSERQWESSVIYPGTLPPTHSKVPPAWSSSTPPHPHCTPVTAGTSPRMPGPHGTKCGSVYPSQYACSTLPLYPSSPRSATIRRKPRRTEHKSSLSLSSTTLGVGGQVVHVEVNEVVLRGDPLMGFGLQLQGGVFATEPLSAPASIRFIEPDTPAERCGLLQVGDRVLSINGVPTEDGTLEEANQLLRDAALSNQVSLEVEFDVAESVVPSSGTFQVKLPKRRGVEVGITISSSKRPGRPLIISEIKRGSIAHRTGTLEPGDRLLAIDNVKLEHCGIEEAMAVLQQAEEMVRLRVQKDEDNLDELESSGSVIFTVELRRHGGPLGITISGTEEPFNPVLISNLTPHGLAHRTGALHVGDRVLAINTVSLKGKPLSEAIQLLQTSGDVVTLKIQKRPEPVLDSDSGSLLMTGSFLSDEDDHAHSLGRYKHPDFHRLATPASLDSAMDSWDSSALDAGYGSQGTYINQTSDTAVYTKSPGVSRDCDRRTAAGYDGKLGERDWKYNPSARCSGAAMLMLRRTTGHEPCRTWRRAASRRSSESSSPP
ncbi:glutamate receptor-interacting protein 2a isoform X5 [Trichomycterus rosablanca]|uniref:glutamate receptor-interacting protein 2a isoform X5 n=1 Tax=Trichomycterus rosablanca TaxID=2290929 RepID=UPI002F351737